MLSRKIQMTKGRVFSFAFANRWWMAVPLLGKRGMVNVNQRLGAVEKHGRAALPLDVRKAQPFRVCQRKARGDASDPQSVKLELAPPIRLFCKLRLVFLVQHA